VRDREGEGGGGGGSEEVELENLGWKGKEKGWRDNRGVKEDNSGVFEVVERVRRVREGIRDVEEGIVRFKVEWINRLVLSGVVALDLTSVDSIVLQWVGVKSRESKEFFESSSVSSHTIPLNVTLEMTTELHSSTLPLLTILPLIVTLPSEQPQPHLSFLLSATLKLIYSNSQDQPPSWKECRARMMSQEAGLEEKLLDVLGQVERQVNPSLLPSLKFRQVEADSSECDIEQGTVSGRVRCRFRLGSSRSVLSKPRFFVPIRLLLGHSTPYAVDLRPLCSSVEEDEVGLRPPLSPRRTLSNQD